MHGDRGAPGEGTMISELINTGSELMLGNVLNTHQQWICGQLARRGWVATRQVAVPDEGPAIQVAVGEALGRADLVITTGGLGPTSDDITREMIAELLGKRLVESAEIREHIARFFASRGRPMPARTRLETLVPEGALILPNDFGTAPGLAIKLQPNPFREGQVPSWLIMLPGPPRELRPMFHNSVMHLLEREFPAIPFACRTLRTTGLGESVVEERVAGPLQECVSAGLELGYCARPGEVDVRLVGRGQSATDLVGRAEAIVRSNLGDCIYGTEEGDLAQTVVHLLTAFNKTVALAESCTGGFISHRLTNVPGASAVVLAGIVSYSNAAKTRFLGVDPDLIAAHGAVSEPVARQMAEGARRETGADYAVAVTGIAGPSGGTPEKPVGTVFYALASADGTAVKRQINPWDRETFKFVTSQQVLDLLRRKVMKDQASPSA